MPLIISKGILTSNPLKNAAFLLVNISANISGTAKRKEFSLMYLIIHGLVQFEAIMGKKRGMKKKSMKK